MSLAPLLYHIPHENPRVESCSEVDLNQEISGDLCDLKIKFLEDQPLSNLELELKDSRGAKIKITASDLDETRVPYLIKPILDYNDSEPESQARSRESILTQVLSRFLSRALKAGANLNIFRNEQALKLDAGIDLKLSIKQRALILAKRILGIGSQLDKAKISFINVGESEQNVDTALKWIHVINPNKEVLDDLARNYQIKPADLQRCLSGAHPPQSYRYGEYLVNRFAELTMNEQTGKVSSNSICAILGKGYLITISQSESKAVETVRREITDSEVHLEEVNSSNYLFTRLFGCSLHLNEDIIYKLGLNSTMFEEAHDSEKATLKLQNSLGEFNRSVATAHRAIDDCPEILKSVGESRNLFGSESPRDCLDRYTTIVQGMQKRLEECSHTLENVRSSWRLAQEEFQNNILFKIAILSAALGPVGFAASFFGINFSHGLQFSNSFIFAALTSGMLVSIALIAALFRKPHPKIH